MDKPSGHWLIKPSIRYSKYYPNEYKMMFLIPYSKRCLVPVNTFYEPFAVPFNTQNCGTDQEGEDKGMVYYHLIPKE